MTTPRFTIDLEEGLVRELVAAVQKRPLGAEGKAARIVSTGPPDVDVSPIFVLADCEDADAVVRAVAPVDELAYQHYRRSRNVPHLPRRIWRRRHSRRACGWSSRRLVAPAPKSVDLRCAQARNEPPTDEDIVFELRGPLIEHYGSKLRNHVARGMRSDYELQLTDPLYLLA